MFETMVLAYLMVRPYYGYELKTSLYRLNPNNNKIYPLLQQLHKKGYVDVQTQVQQGRPNRKVYSITEAGRMHFRALLQAFDFSKAQNADEFNLRICFSSMLDRQSLLKILQMRKEVLENQSNVPALAVEMERSEDVQQLRALHKQLRTLEIAYIERLQKKYALAEQ